MLLNFQNNVQFMNQKFMHDETKQGETELFVTRCFRLTLQYGVNVYKSAQSYFFLNCFPYIIFNFI